MAEQGDPPASLIGRVMVASDLQLALIALLLGMAVLFATSVSGVVLYLHGAEALRNEVRSDVLRQALSAAAALDVGLHQRLTDPAQESGPEYREAIRPLDRIRLASPDVRFIYTYVLRDDQVCFVLDPTPRGDADGDGVEDHSSLFEPYPKANPIMRGVLASGIAATDEEPVLDRWGTTFSGYAPFRDERGRVVGAVGVDLDLKTYEERISGMRKAVASGGLLALACAALVGIGCFAALVALRRAASATGDHQRELVQARELALRADRAKGDFLAMMSHEIRTPINAVIGLADLLAVSGLDDRQREHAETIRASGAHVLAMISDILDYSKIEAGRMELHSIPLSPAVVCEQAVRLLTEAAKAKHLRLDLELGAGLPAAVLGDQVRLRQVLINLIGNAVKFTERGGVRVTVSSPAGDGAIHFAVSDSGIGIDAATRERLFQPFQQVSGGNGGTGLGLAISQSLVRLMGGVIRVESAPGMGSTFSFSLSLPPAPSAAAAPTAASLHPPRYAGRVLVVDDQAVNRVVASAMLHRLGVDCEVAESGAAALTMLRQAAFDLVLMDVQMPGHDGLVTTAELRRTQDRSGRRTPVVALTAVGSPEDERACREAGMDGYLVKPLRIETLAGELEHWLPVVHDGLPPARLAPPPAIAAEADGPPVVDLRTLATLRSLDSDPQAFVALVDGYLADTRRCLELLRSAVAAGRAAEVVRIAHGQRGVALTMGLTAFAAAMAALEVAATGGEREAIAAALAATERESVRALAALASARGG